MANGYQFPYGFRQGNTLTAQRPTATSFFQAAQQGRFGLPKPFEPQSSILAPTMAAIASRTTQPLSTPTSVAMPTAPLARSQFLQERQGVPLPRPRPEGMPPSGLDQLRAAQLRMPAKGSPELAGLSAAAATGLQLSGYQDRPLTTGQIVGSMLGTYNEAQQAAAQRQAAEQQQAIANQLAYLQLQQQMMPDPSKYRQMAIDAGFNPDTPEGIEYIKQLQKATGGISVTVGGDAPVEYGREQMAKLDYTKLSDWRSQVGQSNEVYQIYGQMEDLLENGLQTGRGAEALLGIRQIGAAFNMLTPEEEKQLTDMELFQKLVNRATPLMRPVGSGATSDMEIDMFKSAIANMQSRPETNLLLVKGARQIQEYNQRQLTYFENYYLGTDDSSQPRYNLVGAVQAFNESGDTPFFSASDDQGLYQLVADGRVKEGDVFKNMQNGGYQIMTSQLMSGLESTYGQ